MKEIFKKLVEKIKSLRGNLKQFDPSTLQDEIADKTEWTYAKSGGANFCTHRLVQVRADRIEFHSTIMAKVFYFVFFFIGSAVVIGISYSKISTGNFTFDLETIMPLLIGLVFASVGGVLFYYGTAPIVFDKRLNAFWKGRKSPKEVFDARTLKYFAKLEDIHAIQLISEYISGDKSSYYSYELNLVLEDASRINVVDHGSCEKIREDANTLSKLLNKPVWDAT